MFSGDSSAHYQRLNQLAAAKRDKSVMLFGVNLRKSLYALSASQKLVQSLSFLPQLCCSHQGLAQLSTDSTNWFNSP